MGGNRFAPFFSRYLWGREWMDQREEYEMSRPFLFCGGRGAAEMLTYELLAKYAYEIERRHQHLQKKG